MSGFHSRRGCTVEEEWKRRASVSTVTAAVWGALAGPSAHAAVRSPLTGWKGRGQRSVTSLGNEPREQPVRGDDRLKSAAIRSHLKNKHAHVGKSGCSREKAMSKALFAAGILISFHKQSCRRVSSFDFGSST